MELEKLSILRLRLAILLLLPGEISFVELLLFCPLLVYGIQDARAHLL